MIEVHGKRNTAYIYADKIDKETKTQIAQLLREEAFSDSKIRIMPDTHSGKGCVVGTTMTLHGRVIPSLIGVDIGCGIEVVTLKNKTIDLPSLDKLIHEAVPCGAKIHKTPLCEDKNTAKISELFCTDKVDKKRAYQSIGTLGGGNHFIELDRDETGKLYLVIHSGSRQLGSDTAMYYQDAAYRYQCRKQRKSANLRMRCSDDDGYYTKSSKREQQSVIKVIRERALLEGELFEQYLHDIKIVQQFAELNRRTIARIICDGMGLEAEDRFSCVHNYIETENMILRKGAVSARQGERVIIPLNMRDGAVLGTGLGNPDWNFSAPHGAGRACSRTDARYAYTVEEFQAQMSDAGVYTTTAAEGSLDECPMAYKSPDRILGFLSETVKIDKLIRPVYNFKAC